MDKRVESRQEKEPTSVRRALVPGNVAMAKGALDAGCRFYAGYPITPQNEFIEHMAANMEDRGGTFIQAESELASINLVLGAAAAGARAMTSSSSPGISLMQEGISYMAGMDIPAVIVNVTRGGPGLGSIGPAQSDYLQATRGGGHGDYRTPVLAPASVQESYDMMFEAFALAEEYLTPVLVLSDAVLGQMAECLVEKERVLPPEPTSRPWALCGCRGRAPRVVISLFSTWDRLEETNLSRYQRFSRLASQGQSERIDQEGAQALVVAFGSTFRICKAAASEALARGFPVRLFRPRTLWPFPTEDLRRAAEGMEKILVAEMNMGQMLEDVRIALGDSLPIAFYGRVGGIVLDPEAICAAVLGEPPESGLYREFPAGERRGNQ